MILLVVYVGMAAFMVASASNVVPGEPEITGGVIAEDYDAERVRNWGDIVVMPSGSA